MHIFSDVQVDANENVKTSSTHGTKQSAMYIIQRLYKY